MDYFTYVQKNRLTGLPFYVGYSKHPSRYPWRTEGRRTAWQQAAKDGFTVEIDNVFKRPGEAYARQQRLIWEYGAIGVTLVNHIPKQQSSETRNKISRSLRGNSNAKPRVQGDKTNTITLRTRQGRKLFVVPFDTLQGVELRDVRLKGVYLRGADLRGADLQGADLSYSDMRDVDLRGANLNYVNLSFAMLSGADIRDGSFCGVNLDYAATGGMRLSGTATAGTVFDAEQRDGIDWSDNPCL